METIIVRFTDVDGDFSYSIFDDRNSAASTVADCIHDTFGVTVTFMSEDVAGATLMGDA